MILGLQRIQFYEFSSDHLITFVRLPKLWRHEKRLRDAYDKLKKRGIPQFHWLPNSLIAYSPIAQGYLACARCSNTGSLVLIEPVATFNGGDKPLSPPTTERSYNNNTNAAMAIRPLAISNGFSHSLKLPTSEGQAPFTVEMLQSPGNISWPLEPNQLIICYTEGDSVAESDDDFYNLSSDHPKDAIESRPSFTSIWTYCTHFCNTGYRPPKH
ncbi:hypothetical protein NE237_005469 [Protea cynaroides]|uniref:Uncharacterized protein n=1 Tax=Protea cynaroides TaxID=273540 RepID=A0A9Q0QUB2_9MAGN|nr:hypothetical protein NE237_005469 [Protea cynaroides]